MTTERINSLTKAEIQERIIEARLKQRPRDRPCLWCGTIVKMRPDQNFCSGPCRSHYYKNSVEIQHALVREEAERARTEIQNLLREIHSLRQRVIELEFIISNKEL